MKEYFDHYGRQILVGDLIESITNGCQMRVIWNKDFGDPIAKIVGTEFIIGLEGLKLSNFAVMPDGRKGV